jgi:hypothetical protein
MRVIILASDVVMVSFLSPNLYFDAYMCYVSAGYDYNTFNGRGQFYVRIGAGLTLGLLKSLVNR